MRPWACMNSAFGFTTPGLGYGSRVSHCPLRPGSPGRGTGISMPMPAPSVTMTRMGYGYRLRMERTRKLRLRSLRRLRLPLPFQPALNRSVRGLIFPRSGSSWSNAMRPATVFPGRWLRGFCRAKSSWTPIGRIRWKMWSCLVSM